MSTVTLPAQMSLFETPPSVPDVVMPDDYYEHFMRTKTCKNCHFELRAVMHAFNHYRKFHAPKPKSRFFFLKTAGPGQLIWNEVSHGQFINSRSARAVYHPTRKVKVKA